jgi:5-methylcytosine-specific restriction protein A
LALEHALLDRVTELVTRFETARAAGLPSNELASLLRVIGDARHLTDALGSEVAAELARLSQSPEDSMARRLGDRSAPDAVARLVGIEPSEALDWCAAGAMTASRMSLSGESLPPRHPGLADALRGALLSPRAVRLIGDTLDRLARKLPDEGVRKAEHVLIEVAPGLPGRQLAKLCTQAVDRFDPDGVAPREEELVAGRSLQIVRLPNGSTKWILTLDPLSEGFLRTALDARTAPRRAPTFLEADQLDDPALADRRTLPQRRLDTVVAWARESLLHDHGQLAGTAVTMVVEIPLATLEIGVGPGYIQGVDLPISAGTARRLAAEAEIVPVVLGTNSVPLDYGESARLFNQPQRRAMALRDGGCVFCGAPPGWCQAAHLKPWALTRQTNLANGALMCPSDHARFDLEHWELEWRNGEPWLIPPAFIDATRTPRRGWRPRLPAIV